MGKFRKIQKKVQEHKERLIDRGVIVTINSDDPAYFGADIFKNLDQLHSELKFLGDAERDRKA
jgi:adenosine deaminase